jgi:hypothetical protein
MITIGVLIFTSRFTIIAQADTVPTGVLNQ